MNNISLAGTVTSKGCQVRVAPNGDKVAKFSLSVRNQGKDKGKSYFEVEAWSKAAEWAEQHALPGAALTVTGRMESEEYEKDGRKQKAWKVKGAQLGFVPKDFSQENGNQLPQAGHAAEPHDDWGF